MPNDFVLKIDLANVYSQPKGGECLTTVAWGDRVDVADAERADGVLKVRTTRFVQQPDGSIRPQNVDGFIRPPKSSKLKPADLIMPRSESKVLKVNFIDVQQGDGSVIETPQERIILIDGGDNQLFARYLANRFLGSSLETPQPIEAIVVTHGDADHFAGLTEIAKSETNKTLRKRCFIKPKRVYHNGLVKRPSSRPEKEQLGPTKKAADGTPILVDLVDDLLAVPDAEMNKYFKEWKRALRTYADRNGPIAFRHLMAGDDDAFAFLADENITVKVLGPLPTPIDGQKGLAFLHQPPEGPQVRDEAAMKNGSRGSLSASHTINGHSIVLHVTYGRFHFLFAGDLNAEAERSLLKNHKKELEAEVFKVPHHGSADFSPGFLEAVAPVVSVVSSGDESARKEYIHPRATLVGALGRYSRVEEPLIFVTELVAFFEVEGWTDPEGHKTDAAGAIVPLPRKKSSFFAFSRTAFGAVKVRTDGERLLVYTNSGQKDLKEAYAFIMKTPATPGGPDEVVPTAVVKV